MKKTDIDRFFREVSRQLTVPARVYLTGGIASWFMGGERPTEDIDFALKTKPKKWSEAADVFQKASQTLGIPIEYSENISRWSLIDIPDYEKTAKIYKRFDLLTVYLLDVPAWSVGKICRYYQSDVNDLLVVIRHEKTKPEALVKVWAKALKISPKSTSQILFCKTAEDFLERYGPKIWGKTFPSERHIKRFRNLAGIKKA